MAQGETWQTCRPAGFHVKGNLQMPNVTNQVYKQEMLTILEGPS